MLPLRSLRLRPPSELQSEVFPYSVPTIRSLGELDLWVWPASGPDQTTQLAAWLALALFGVLIQRRA